MIPTIKNRRDFLALAQGRLKYVMPNFIVQAAKRPHDHPVGAEFARVGYTVTKKMGNAVVRNRIKRRLREAFRQSGCKYAMSGYDYVIISRTKALHSDFSELQRDMEFAFSRIIAKKDSHH